MATLAYPGWRFLTNPLCGAGFIEYHVQILKPAFIAVVAGFGAYACISLFDGIWIRLLFGSIVGLILSYLLNSLFNKRFLEEIKGFRK